MRIPTYFLVLSFAFAVALPAGESAAADKVDLELILGVDVSRSIDYEEAELQRAGYVAAFRDPAILRAIQSGRQGRIAVTYIEWSSAIDKRVLADWTVIDGPGAAEAFADTLAEMPIQTGSRTSISGVIDFALPHFEQDQYQGFRRVLDISGDGPNNSGRLVTLARDEAVAKGITINGLPIMNGRPSRGGRPPLPDLDLYYKACVIGGFGAFYVVAESFDTFAQAIRKKLILEIAGRATDRRIEVASIESHAGPGEVWAHPVPWQSGPEARTLPRLLHLATAERTPPPCNIGELQFQQRWRDLDN